MSQANNKNQNTLREWQAMAKIPLWAAMVLKVIITLLDVTGLVPMQ